MDIEPKTISFVNYEGVEYMRISADVWFMWYSNSFEPLHFCDTLEAAYQKEASK